MPSLDQPRRPDARGGRRWCRPLPAAALVLGLLLLVPGPADSPGDTVRPAPSPPGDTVPVTAAVVEDARERQRDFERERRVQLPFGGGGPDRCDEIVGRYCLWHGDGEDDWEPVPDSESVREARARLLEHLARAAEAAPGSGWVAGQRVRYLLEAGRGDEALRAARGCRAQAWWCRALEGKVLHEQGRFEEAGRVFGRALAVMDSSRRRRWTDVDVLLEGDADDRWDRLDPAGRRRMARRFWRMADPFSLVPGNDRRTEHLARRVAARNRRDAATPFGRFWNEGLEELTLRYGVPVEYRREPPSPSRLSARPSVTGRHHPDALSFLPRPGAVLAPGGAEPGDWRLDARRPHASYAPSYADTVARLRHRLAVFPRGDTTVVAAVYRARTAAEASRSHQGRTEAFLGLVPVAALGDSAPPTPGQRRTGRAAGALAVRVAPRTHLLSLEVLHRDAERAQRARYAVRLERRPEGVPGLSDLLLVRPSDAPPATLEDAVSRAVGPGPLRAGQRVGVYWELYGPRLLLRDVEVSLALADGDGDWLERLAGAAGLEEGAGVALGWRDAAGRPGRVRPRGLELRLPRDLSAGTYRLELSVRIPGYDPMTAARRLEVETAERR